MLVRALIGHIAEPDFAKVATTRPLCLDGTSVITPAVVSGNRGASRYFAPAWKALGPGTKNPKVRDSRSTVLKVKQTASASSICSR
jgi:hypothetical protein